MNETALAGIALKVHITDHVILAHLEHMCTRRWSDQRSLWSGHLDLGLVRDTFTANS